MKIILLSGIKKLGNLGDKICVKSGYARNFLIPNGSALIANKANVKFVSQKKESLEKKLLDKLLVAEFRAKKIRKVIQPVVIVSKSRKEGKLFGSVGSREISEALSKLSGIKVKKGEIRLLSGIIRNIGKYDIIFKPHNTIDVSVNISVVPNE
ncbi:hypothetical protein XW81_02600 [Buchnera aphidicola (Schlechtendalia chinensis)]|uniref:Large ribosomal subunit protein bL9 n=1 Tax=Buchnera aphidicola subsp. Schlechtendalia chinensis TaxID=118110 RepID=A0A172WE84_BUCSC|nr:50S ribosomal protein L9 [Buchnera aphidicola]ANF17257.1 hypothetical protein XW81_02600 [Buchnera aphidicola (Schlechtendalia chinensis)]